LTQFSLGSGLAGLVLDGTELDRAGQLCQRVETGHALPLRGESDRLDIFLPFRCLQCPLVVGVDQAVTSKITRRVKVPVLDRRRGLVHHDLGRAGHLIQVRDGVCCDAGALYRPCSCSQAGRFVQRSSVLLCRTLDQEVLLLQ